MPVYEYEPDDHLCAMCDGRVRVIQSINEAPIPYCPDCGLPVRKVVSNVQIKLNQEVDPERTKGFSTFRRAESGVWEKIAGPGPETINRPKKDEG
jgi:putative FmdB family regulatory protein